MFAIIGSSYITLATPMCCECGTSEYWLGWTILFVVLSHCDVWTSSYCGGFLAGLRVKVSIVVLWLIGESLRRLRQPAPRRNGVGRKHNRRHTRATRALARIVSLGRCGECSKTASAIRSDVSAPHTPRKIQRPSSEPLDPAPSSCRCCSPEQSSCPCWRRRRTHRHENRRRARLWRLGERWRDVNSCVRSSWDWAQRARCAFVVVDVRKSCVGSSGPLKAQRVRVLGAAGDGALGEAIEVGTHIGLLRAHRSAVLGNGERRHRTDEAILKEPDPRERQRGERLRNGANETIRGNIELGQIGGATDLGTNRARELNCPSDQDKPDW
jgi:hypothetical protein